MASTAGFCSLEQLHLLDMLSGMACRTCDGAKRGRTTHPLRHLSWLVWDYPHLRLDLFQVHLGFSFFPPPPPLHRAFLDQQALDLASVASALSDRERYRVDDLERPLRTPVNARKQK